MRSFGVLSKLTLALLYCSIHVLADATVQFSYVPWSSTDISTFSTALKTC